MREKLVRHGEEEDMSCKGDNAVNVEGLRNNMNLVSALNVIAQPNFNDSWFNPSAAAVPITKGGEGSPTQE